MNIWNWQNWEKLGQTGKHWTKLGETGENWKKLGKLENISRKVLGLTGLPGALLYLSIYIKLLRLSVCLSRDFSKTTGNIVMKIGMDVHWTKGKVITWPDFQLFFQKKSFGQKTDFFCLNPEPAKFEKCDKM